MQDEIFYKGYLITALPQRLVDSNKWTTYVGIMKDYRSHVTEKGFSAANQWDTEEEAIENSINYGKQIVDGMHPDMQLP